MNSQAQPTAASIHWDTDGLVPAVVIDVADGAVLMLAWMDQEAYAATLATGDVHFHSRSRDQLWRKGATSGNVLRLRSIALDCDADALLVTAEPLGPTCHTGTRSCFTPAGERAREGFGWLEELWTTIVSRASERPAGSYTVSLLEAGVDGPARKVAEEATEVLMAAKDDAVASLGTDRSDRDRTSHALTAEAADLIFHLLVLLKERDVAPSRVLAELRARQ